jgi:acyl carrier protein
VPNVKIYILDSHSQPVPIGLAGELHVGGGQLARGYLNRRELTAEKFVQHPFKSGSLLYRTGDRARYLPDGNIEFLGRMDHQVKIRGFRIELGEIEAVLDGHPDLSACAVVTQNHGGRDKILTAFVVGRAQADITVEALRHWLGEKLPEYMIPSRFFLLPALPLTPNGKMDRKALEMLGGVELAVGMDFVAPRDERERELAEIWQAVLRRERVGVHDNFFDLGGHSLLAVQVVSRMRQAMDVEVPLRTLFEYPTISALAGIIPTIKGSNVSLAPPPVPMVRNGLLPLSFAQQRMWLLNRFEGKSTACHMQDAMRLRGCEVSRAQAALMPSIRCGGFFLAAID